jgi:hypothetical protein
MSFMKVTDERGTDRWINVREIVGSTSRSSTGPTSERFTGERMFDRVEGCRAADPSPSLGTHVLF